MFSLLTAIHSDRRMDQAVAINRLKGLLGFVAELATLDQRDRVPRTELRAVKGGPLVLPEQQLRLLAESATTSDEAPLLTLGGVGGAWLQLRRVSARVLPSCNAWRGTFHASTR